VEWRNKRKKAKLMATQVVGVATSVGFNGAQQSVYVAALIFVDRESERDEVSVDESLDGAVWELDSGKETDAIEMIKSSVIPVTRSRRVDEKSRGERRARGVGLR